jgi:ABC-2 type transport system permease protein
MAEHALDRPYRNGVREIWRHRQVLRMLVLRDLQRKYTRFRLGYLWTLLEPLGMSIVLWFVFNVLLGARGLGLQPYLLFLSVAILPWWWFAQGVGSMTKIFRRPVTASAVRLSLLPTQIWVLRVVLASMIEFILSLPVILIGVALTGFLPGPLIIFFPIAIIVQFILMYGLGLLIAAGSAVFPDLARLVRIVLRAMFYLSPVLYSISNIPASVQSIASLNPLVGVLGLYRIGWWPEEMPSISDYAISLGLCLVIFILGIIVFRRSEARILKEA